MITTSKTLTNDIVPIENGYNFRSLSISHKSKPIAISLLKSKSIQKQKKPPRCFIGFSDFDFKFEFEIIKIEGELPSTKIVLYLKLNDNLIKAVLSGDWQDDEGLYINNFGFGVEKQGETPVSAFLLKTLWAMLGLSTKIDIQIPILNQKAAISFDLNINELSDLLKIRQIAHRLMVIEKAFNIELPFPEFVVGKDVVSIAYCYHSVVNRKFEWFCPPTTIPWFATQKYLSFLPKKNVPFQMQYGPEPFTKEIFGYQIDLGLQSAKIEDYILDNFNEVKTKLSKLDGSEISVQAHSKNGVMQVESITTPHLPENSFSKDIQKLIDLDKKLDSMVFDKYLNSFSNAFEGLTDEQIQAITERPSLDEEAFNF